MALNFPTPAAANDLYTDDNGRQWIYDGTKWIVDVGTANRTFTGVKIVLQAYAAMTATPTALDFDDEEFDVGNYFTLTAASRVTVDRTGYYRIDGTFYTGTSGSGSSYEFALKRNGSQTLTTQNAAANQSANYDAILLLEAGDYLEVYCSESTATGTLLAGSYMQVVRMGLTPGSGVTGADAFSGARTNLNSAVNMTSSLVAISWTGTDYNLNADSQGNTYWSVGSPSRFTVKLTGYYLVRSKIDVGTSGVADSYSIELRKNGTTAVTTSTLSPNDFSYLDEIYKLNANDYLEIYATNSGGVGTVLATSNFEIVRLGV